MAKAPHRLALLPPKLSVEPLIAGITAAHFSVGKLNGVLSNVPNLDILTGPLLTKEAVLSSRIEGTQATLEEVFHFDADAGAPEGMERQRDVQEIINYRQAVRTGVRLVGKDGITLPVVKRLHSVLMNSVRGSTKDRGRFRNVQVHIGAPGSALKEARYIPPAPQHILSLLKNWSSYAQSTEYDPLVQAAIGHYQFEAIHPFLDGNGRTGRLLLPLQLFQRGTLQYPVLYVSEYLEEHRRMYYDLLQRVTDEGDWQAWVAFFVQGVRFQADRTSDRVHEMLRLRQELQQRVVAFRSAYASLLVDALFASPRVTFTSLRSTLPKSGNQTIYNLLAKFERAGIIRKVGINKRNRVYEFRALVDLLKGGEKI